MKCWGLGRINKSEFKSKMDNDLELFLPQHYGLYVVATWYINHLMHELQLLIQCVIINTNENGWKCDDINVKSVKTNWLTKLLDSISMYDVLLSFRTVMGLYWTFFFGFSFKFIFSVWFISLMRNLILINSDF